MSRYDPNRRDEQYTICPGTGKFAYDRDGNLLPRHAKTICPGCGREKAVRADGTIRLHKKPGGLQ